MEWQKKNLSDEKNHEHIMHISHAHIHTYTLFDAESILCLPFFAVSYASRWKIIAQQSDCHQFVYFNAIYLGITYRSYTVLLHFRSTLFLVQWLKQMNQ